METTKKRSFKKKASAVVAVIAIIALLITGTFAWRDYSQHKTNETSGSTTKYDARLVEDFEEVTDWDISDPIVTKEIRVANKGKAEDGFGDVYVRIQLKEYMEIGKLTYTQTAERYMIDTDGNFITFPTKAEAEAAYPGHVVTELTDAVTKATGWFIQTQAKDDNGQYGKFVVLDFSVGDSKSLVDGVIRADKDATEKHQIKDNGECLYTVHTWDGSDITSCENGSDENGYGFHDYISWILGDDVISLTDWIAGGSLPVAKWIYDDQSNSGWVYWGQALSPDSETSNLLEKIELIKQPDGAFYYAIHTEMESVSIGEFYGNDPQWTDAPVEIIDSYKDNVASVKIDQSSSTIVVGDKITLTAAVTPSTADQTVTWSSSKENIATVNPATGEVTGVAPGTTTITATSKDGKTAKITVTVVAKSIPATGITADKNNVTLAVGDSEKVTATPEPADATSTIVWKSNDTSVATVDQNGNITGEAPGSTTVTATIDGETVTINVTIEPKTIPATGITVDKSSLSMIVGDSEKVTATVTPSTATGVVVWSSSSTSVATVDQNGNIRAVGAGTATITAKIDGKTATVTVTVAAASLKVKTPNSTDPLGYLPTIDLDYRELDNRGYIDAWLDMPVKFRYKASIGETIEDAYAYFLLDDILDESYDPALLTIKVNNSDYEGGFYIGKDKQGNNKPAIISTILPTRAECEAAAAKGEFPIIPVSVTLTQSGRSTTITLLVTYAGFIEIEP